MAEIILDTDYGPCDVRALARQIEHRTRLVEVQYYPGLDVRLAMVANALSIIGVQAGYPQTIKIFDDLLGPPFKWPLSKPFGGGGISTCSMVALGLLRRMGVAHEGIMAGYKIGTGMRVAHDWAKTLKAFVHPISGVRPLPGDIVDLCPYPGKGDRSNHTGTVIGYHGDTLVCVDGGQVGLGRLQAISVTRRPWLESRDGNIYAGQREVYGWIDVEKLIYQGPVIVPDGVLPSV